MTIAYLCIFLVGFALLAGSFLLGLDHDADMHVEHDLGDHTMSPSVFSLKVIACFLMGFGIAASITKAAGGWLLAQVALGLIGGIGFGFLGWLVIKFFLSQQASSVFTQEDFVGQVGTIILPANDKKIGEVQCTIKGAVRTIDAKSESPEFLHLGRSVKVIRIEGNVAIVAKV